MRQQSDTLKNARPKDSATEKSKEHSNATSLEVSSANYKSSCIDKNDRRFTILFRCGCAPGLVPASDYGQWSMSIMLEGSPAAMSIVAYTHHFVVGLTLTHVITSTQFWLPLLAC